MHETEVKKPKALLGIRHVQCIMLFFAMLLAFAMRVNMSMAIVAMTNSTIENSFNWSLQIQSAILSSFFWGYVILQVPGGLLADTVGGSTLITFSVGINSLICLILPTAANYGGWYAVCGCRVLQGLTQGFIYPSMHNLIGKWVPLEEKSRLGTFVYAGAHLGTASMLICAGFLADFWGWASIFYSIGLCGAIWTVIFVFIGSSSPQTSKFISEEEKLYIQTSLGQVGGKKVYPTPWKSLFISLPFISVIIAHCCQNWGFFTLMTEMPSYMSQVLGVNIKANGVLSALPYIALYILSFPVGFFSDYALAKDWVTITTVRKTCNTVSTLNSSARSRLLDGMLGKQYLAVVVLYKTATYLTTLVLLAGFIGPAVALIGLAYVPPGDIALAVGLLSIVVGLNAGHMGGFLLVHLDMAPNFAGTMLGITNCIANIISIIAPLAAGVIIKDETDVGEWKKVFYLASFVYVFGNTLFLIFGSSEQQSWNKPKEDKQVENDAEKNSSK